MAPGSRAPWRALATRFPPERFLLSPLASALYGSDAQPALFQPPAAVVFPLSPEEVVSILRFCHEHHLPFVPRGSGTGLCGACCPPSPDALVISFQEMNRILSLNSRERSATVQPGVTPAQLNREAHAHGLRYVPDPGARQAATLGGNLALDAAGPNAHLAGSTATQLLAATVILPDGSVAECGAHSGGSTLCANPLALLPRSEGAFGLVVEMTLALHARPASRAMLTASFPRLSAALEASDSLLVAGLLPAQLELFDARTWSALTGPPGPGSESVLWCVLEGPSEDAAAELSTASALLQKCGAFRVEIISDPQRIASLRQRRDGLPAALGTVLVQDGIVPRSRLAEALELIERLEREESVAVPLFLDAATGNLFPCFRYEPARTESFRRAERAALRFLLHCAEAGGSIAGRHGLGREKRGLFASVLPEEESRFLRELHVAFHGGPAIPVPPSVSLYPLLPGEANPALS